jgi:hypothetical protein
MRAVLVLALALALSGCGVLDDEGPALPGSPDPAVYGPAKAVPRSAPTVAPVVADAPSAAVARALERGAIGVVDLSGTVAIEPSSLETATDQTLSDVRWKRWDADGASGAGELRLLTCEPTCAGGGSERVAARIELSGVKTCDGRRYFERGKVLLDPKDTPSGAQPATYLRAPC